MAKSAVLVVDVQNEYFPSGKLPLDGIERAAGNAAKGISQARERGELVVHIRHERPEGPIFLPGSPGAEIHAVVAPVAGEPVVTKNFPNAFRSTDLQAILDREGIDRVVVVGAMSHMCIDATVRAANDLGYATTTVHDACATRDLEFAGTTVPSEQVHKAIMAALAFAYGEVIDTETWLSR